MVSHELSKPRRIELILRQIDALPTLPAVATRLLALTSDDDSSTKEVTQLIQSDPSLTAKVLSLCKTADKGVRSDILTIDRAVVLLGFNAIRNAVLSVKVMEVFGGTVDGDLDSPMTGGRLSRDNEDDGTGPVAGMDRRGFWMHSLAVAIAAEQIAKAHRDPELPADEAFVCGLLHDMGKLALDHVLPRSFARVVELAEINRDDIAEVERKVVGIDHHTAGKRLAEQWNLPLRLQDSIWLHGSPFDTLPKVEHRRLVGLVKLADAVVRDRHVGYSGNYRPAGVEELTEKLGLDLDKVRQSTAGLFAQLEERGQALGIHDDPSHELALDSIQRANQALGRANQALERRSRTAAVQTRILEILSEFNSSMAPARSVQDAIDAVAASARGLLGDGFYAVIYPTRHDDPHPTDDRPRPDGYWLVSQYNKQGEPADARYLDTPPHTPDIAALDASRSIGVELMGVLPWIADYLIAADDLRDVRMLPLPCGWGTVAIMLHDRPSLPGWNLLGPLAGTWGNAIAAAAQHAGARRLGEELASANAALDAAQDKLLHTESLARLGEMAAGAAHEMNNPLAVISGRSQLMSATLPPGTDHQKSAQMIFRESHRLSDLISCLRMFADPPQADRKPADLAQVLNNAVSRIRKSVSKNNAGFAIDLQVPKSLPAVEIDADQIDRAVTELLFNAVQASPKSAVLVSVKVDPPWPDGPSDTDATPATLAGRMLLIQVTDDGAGMDAHTLHHALDPFFSAKPAGRQVGMGLPRAEQLAQAHGGSVRLRSEEGHGTVATLNIALDSPPATPDEGDGEPPRPAANPDVSS
ncbi:MAG: HDOD domain-containing protein [Planctomycetota bacterium]